MLKSFSLKSILIAGAVALLSTGAQAASLTTGDFSGWLPRVFGFDGGTSTISFPLSGGNPDAFLQVTNTTNSFSSFVYAGVLNPIAMVAPSGTWSSTLTIDFNSNVNPGGDQHAIGLLAEQDASLFFVYLGVTGVSSGWEQFSSGAFSLTSGDFGRLSGSGTLDLTQPFLAGFSTANSRSGTRGSAYDNLAVAGLQAATPVPVPASVLLLGAGLAGVGALRARRHAR